MKISPETLKNVESLIEERGASDRFPTQAPDKKHQRPQNVHGFDPYGELRLSKRERK